MCEHTPSRARTHISAMSMSFGAANGHTVLRPSSKTCEWVYVWRNGGVRWLFVYAINACLSHTQIRAERVSLPAGGAFACECVCVFNILKTAKPVWVGIQAIFDRKPNISRNISTNLSRVDDTRRCFTSICLTIQYIIRNNVNCSRNNLSLFRDLPSKIFQLIRNQSNR